MNDEQRLKFVLPENLKNQPIIGLPKNYCLPKAVLPNGEIETNNHPEAHL